MVEQLTLNQRVGGSSPPRFTTHSAQDFQNLLFKGPCLKQECSVSRLASGGRLTNIPSLVKNGYATNFKNGGRLGG
jgi:hypothetical protein